MFVKILAVVGVVAIGLVAYIYLQDAWDFYHWFLFR